MADWMTPMPHPPPYLMEEDEEELPPYTETPPDAAALRAAAENRMATPYPKKWLYGRRPDAASREAAPQAAALENAAAFQTPQ